MELRVLLAFFTPVLLSAACDSSGNQLIASPTPNAPPLLLQDCDPIVPTHCGFPFPSNVWTKPDATRATGMHVYFGDGTLPTFAVGQRIDKTPFVGRDGFSPGGGIMTHLPGATMTGLADAYHIADSVAPGSPTVLLESGTGALIPHWVEIDALPLTNTYDAQHDVDARTFIIRPAVRLKDGTRYIVAIRDVVDDSGAAIPASPVFQALRDGTASNDLSVAPRRALYADILGQLASAGVSTSKLQIAWDFTTASKADTTQWMLHMRDDALSKVGTQGPAYTYTQCAKRPAGTSADACGVFDNPNPYIRRRIVGQMTVPLYVDDPAPGSSIVFGGDGMPTQSGTAAFQFLVQIPNSLVNRGETGPIVQNGHGLFGKESEGQDDYVAEICDREGYVEIAVDMVGMSAEDVGYITNVAAGDVSQFSHVVDRLHQGFINELLAMRMMRGAFATDPATIIDGKPTIDPTHAYYRGDSQGGITGGVYMAITTDVTRGLLGEPGAPFNTLLDRSTDFGPFFVIIKATYPNPLDIQFGLGLIQTLWDRAEPDGYIPYISENMLEGTPAHNVLLFDGLGDQEVTPLGAHFIARTIGAQNLEATNREVYGIADAPSGFTGNGMCEWNFELPASQSPITNTPPDSSLPDPHTVLREQGDAQDMADIFFRTGTVVQTCAGGGPCAAPTDWSTTNILPPAATLDAGLAETDAGDAGDAATP